MSKKIIAGIFVMVAIVVAVIAQSVHNGRRLDATQKRSAMLAGAASGSEGTSSQDPIVDGEGLFASGSGYEKLEAEDRKITPVVAPYVVEPDLSNVANRHVFAQIIGPEQRALIAKNGFVVTPTSFTQMYHVYEENEYHRPDKVPAFITTDAMLHTYHVFYDYSLRVVEVTKLYDAAVGMTDAMLAASQKDFAAAKDPDLKEIARRNVAYFAVARKLLTGVAVPKEVQDIAGADLDLIDKHEGFRESSVLGGVSMDFSQFVPRGHYTRSEKLKKYFKGLMWYGLSPFPIKDPKAYPGAREDLEQDTTIQALMIVRNLRSVSHKGVPVIKLWDKVYKPTAFYVGTADDYTVYDYAKLSDKVFGKSPDIEAFADKAQITKFMDEVKKLPGPRIENYGGENPTARMGRQFRFMGQRFIADSRILQELTHPKVVHRNFPAGLDVFAAMGSDRAYQLLKTEKKTNYPRYDEQLDKMRAEMRSTPIETWESNLYYGWLWSLDSLVKPAPKGYPSFMQNNAWLDKSLLSGLGSWTELRHDTILYAKQSVTAECGGDGEHKEPPMPKGYVEPNLEFWSKLQWLNEYTRQGLSSRGLLNDDLNAEFDQIGDWIQFCRRITIKELTNQRVTDDEYKQMEMFGPDLEQLTVSFAGSGASAEVFSDTDNDMALIADVHTYENSCLEEGTGRAAAIYVVVPIEGKLYLTRGAVYTHYEFVQPSSNRLTDEEWQKMLEKPRPMADWTKSFFSNMKKPDAQFDSGPVEKETGGC